MSTAVEELTALRERNHSGDGLLHGSVTIDQIYAHYQHEDLTLHHPRGGGPKYLERPLFEHADRYLEEIAHSVLDGGVEEAMARCMEDLSDAAEGAAPFFSGALSHSGHPEVRRGERVVYDRPPKMHRLTRPELQELARRRLDAPGMGRLKGWIYWHNTTRGRLGLPPPRRQP